MNIVEYWIGLDVNVVDKEMLRNLVANSHTIVKTKYKKKSIGMDKGKQ